MITTIFVLLVVFQFKHFICDYLLQGEYMLGKFKPGWDFILPLTAHCLVHVVATFLIAFLTSFNFKLSLVLSVFDFITHFIMDRIKASPNILGCYKPNQKEFWWCLGLDQKIHHLVHYTIIFILVSV